MRELKVGDVVVLKPGSPSMTIVHIGGIIRKDMVTYNWFDEKDEVQGANFPVSSLELDEED